MHLAVYVLLVVLGAALAHSLIAAAVPAGTPQKVMLLAVGAAAGLLLFDRILRAAPIPAPPLAAVRALP